MADSQADIKASYPLPVYNYKVTIGSEVMGFSEVSGLDVEYEAVTYKHGLSFVTGNKIIPGMRKPIQIALKRGLVKNRSFLGEWFTNVYTDPFYAQAKRDVQIDLCDEQGQAVIRWTVLRALPTKLSAPVFNVDTNDVAVESLELIAHGLKVNYSP